MLNAYTCAECGRCERACPAVASGAKLSPRQIVHELKDYVLHEGLALVAAGTTNGGRGPELIGGMVEPEALWACTSCYACVEKCPVRNEHVPLIVEMRRKLVEQGQLDATLQETLMSLQRYGNSQGKSPRKRFEWANGLPQPLKDAAQGAGRDALVPGRLRGLSPVVHAGLADRWPRSSRRWDWISACLLKDERSAGNDVRRVGEEGLFEMLAEKNMKALEKAQFQRIVTTDPAHLPRA